MAYATTTYIALALAAASTGTAIYSQQQQAKSAANAAEYNNQLAQREAQNRELESAEASRRERIKNRRRLARIRNQLAASGTLTTTGTPLTILGESSANMEIGLADAKRRSDMEAAALRQQGQMGLWEADNYQQAANLNSVATGLSGLSSMGSAYARGAYSGALPGGQTIYRTRAVS